MANTGIFSFFVVPNGYDAKTDTQRFSVCFEINEQHSVFLKTATADDIKAWKCKVRQFPARLSEAVKALDPLKINIYKPDNSPLDPNIRTIAATALPWGIAEAGATIPDLWQAFLGFTKASFDNGKLSFSPMLELAAQQPVIPPVNGVDFPQSALHFVPQPRTPLDKTGKSLFMKDPEVLSVTDFANHLTEIKDQNDPDLRKRIEAGILRQDEIFRQQNENRFQKIKAANEELYSTVYSRFDSIHAQFRKSITQLPGLEQLSVTRLVEKHLAFQAVKYMATNQPVYIKEAINKMNEHLCLRRLLGTIIDFSVCWKVLQQLMPALQEVSFALELALDKSGAESYFDKQVSRFRVAGQGFDSNLIIAQPDGAHEATILKIGSNCRIYDYEAENASRNLDEAMRRTALGADGGADVNVSLGFAKNQQMVHAGLFTSLKKESIVTAFNDNREFAEALQKVQSVNKQITDIHTKGQAVFIADTKKIEPNDRNKQGDLDERDLVKGYVILVRKKGTYPWRSLTECSERFIYPSTKPQQEIFDLEELGINIGGIVHCADPVGQPPGTAAGTGVTGLVNGFLFLWDGTSVSFRNPMSKQEARTASPDDQRLAAIKEYQEGIYDVPVEYHAVYADHKALFGVDWFPFKRYRNKGAATEEDERLADSPPPFRLLRQYIYNKEQVKLKFGESYEYLAIAQYHNGFVPMLDTVRKYNQNQNTTNVTAFAIAQAHYRTLPDPSESEFLRHDHIKDMIISFDDDIYQKDETHVLQKEHLGESNKDLVIRTSGKPTSQSCSRFILPPPVPSFSLYLWYNRNRTGLYGDLSNKNISLDEAGEWYRKYQCQQSDHSTETCPWGCKVGCKKTTQDRIYDGRLNYLPDPIVTGFVVRFFLNQERTLAASSGLGDQSQYPDTFCAFKKGNYPQLRPWSVVMKNDRQEDKNIKKVVADRGAQELTVFVRQGLTLFAEIIPTYDGDASHFHPNIAFAKDHFTGKDDETGLYFDSLYANISELTFTHASRLPLFEPLIQKVDLYRFHKSETSRKENELKVVMDLNFEHLNLWNGIPIPGSSQTGELDLYALWDDYSGTSQGAIKNIDQKKNEDSIDGGFIKIATVKFRADAHDQPAQPLAIADTKQMDSSRRHMETIEFFTDNHFNITHCSDIVFKIRQTSKFISYFKEGRQIVDETGKEFFSLWSMEAMLPAEERESPVSIQETTASSDQKQLAIPASYSKVLFNNNKPKTPVIEKIVPVIVEDVTSDAVVFKGVRVRIYLKTENLMLTGKNERIGIIVSPAGQEEKGKYADVFIAGNHYSKCAADAVTDFPVVKMDNLLKKHNFTLDQNMLEKKYWDLHMPVYEPEKFSVKNEKIGLATYRPAFDEEQQLWYIEPELNITNNVGLPFHVTWIQLNIVSYNAVSAAYPETGGTTAAVYEKDYRLSNPLRLDFTYLYPQRNCINPALIFKNKTTKDFTFSCSVNSLFINRGVLASQFFVHLEKKEGGAWILTNSTITGYKINRVAKGSGTEIPVLQDFALLPLDSNYDSRRAQNIEISFSLKFDKTWFGDYRAVITEIEYYDPELTLKDLQKLLSDTGADVAQVQGVRVINNMIIDY